VSGPAVSGAGEAVWSLAPFAGAIAASPVAIGVALVILLGHRGRHHVWIYLGTWFASITVAMVVILHLLPTWSNGGPGDTPNPVLGRFIGVGLLLLAGFAAWRAFRSRGSTSLVTRLVDHLDRAPAVVVAVIAVVFAINPVHLALMTAGVDAIPGSAPAGLVALVVAAVFAGVTSVPLLLVAGTVVALPDRADSTLLGVNTWLASRGDTMSAVVLTAAGVWVLLP
jgi:hypothetical protein